MVFLLRTKKQYRAILELFNLSLREEDLIIIDISEFYDTTVKVERPTADGKSPTGAPIKGIPTIIFASLLCTTQTDENTLIMPVAGQTLIDYRIMYCDLVDIRAKDTVTILTTPAGVNVGTKYLVAPINDYSTEGMEHLEVKLQGGVV